MKNINPISEELIRHKTTMIIFNQWQATAVDYSFDEIDSTGEGFMVFDFMANKIRIRSAIVEKEYLKFLDEQDIKYKDKLDAYDVYMDIANHIYMFIDKTGKLKKMSKKVKQLKKIK